MFPLKWPGYERPNPDASVYDYVFKYATAVFRFDGDYKVREIYRLFPTLLGSRNHYLSGACFPPGFPYTTDGINPPFAGYPDHSVTVESSFSEEGARVVEFRFPTRVEFTAPRTGLEERLLRGVT